MPVARRPYYDDVNKYKIIIYINLNILIQAETVTETQRVYSILLAVHTRRLFVGINVIVAFVSSPSSFSNIISQWFFLSPVIHFALELFQ